MSVKSQTYESLLDALINQRQLIRRDEDETLAEIDWQHQLVVDRRRYGVTKRQASSWRYHTAAAGTVVLRKVLAMTPPTAHQMGLDWHARADRAEAIEKLCCRLVAALRVRASHQDVQAMTLLAVAKRVLEGRDG